MACMRLCGLVPHRGSAARRAPTRRPPRRGGRAGSAGRPRRARPRPCSALVDGEAGEGRAAGRRPRPPGPSTSTRRCRRRRRPSAASPGRWSTHGARRGRGQAVEVGVGRGRSPAGRRCARPCPTSAAPRPASGPRCWRRRRRRRCGRRARPSASRMVSRSARAWHGWPSSDSRLTTGSTDAAAAMRSSVGVVEHPGADDARGSRRGCGRCPRRSPARRGRPRRPGCRPGGRRAATTAISVELRVRADGFSKSSATPWPASSRRVGSARRRSSTAASSSAREVVDLEEVAHVVRGSRAARSPRMADAPRRSRRRSRAAAAPGAARVGVTALTTRPAAERAGGDRPWRRRRPARRPAAGPARAPRRRRGARPARRRAGRRPAAARAGTSSASITASTARAAAGGQRLAAEGRGVVAGLEGGGHLGPGPAGADRHAVAQRLGHRDDVGHDAEVLEAEPAAGAAEAGLHLVDHEQDARARRTARRTPWKYSGVAGFTPPSPCTGSSSTAATRRVERRVERVEVVPGARGGSPRAGAGTPRASAGWPVACSVARVRPWNEP